MTSYQIQAHVGRAIHPSWDGAASSLNGTSHLADRPSTSSASCAFCKIVKGQGKAYTVWEDEETIAFLDLMPIRPGHTLLIPKSHCPRISDLDPQIGASIGSAIPQITKAITKATGNDDLNVVLNQGYAQAVYHAHFHLIPAPHPNAPPHGSRSSKASSRSTRKVADWTATELQQSPPSHREMLRGETDARSGYLSERDGLDISQRIRSFL